MSRQGSIASLGGEISALASAFDQLVAQVGDRVAVLSQEAQKGAEERLENAREGSLAQASAQAARLRRIITEYQGIESNFAVLEQLSEITTHLKSVVKDLESAHTRTSTHAK